MRPVRGEHRPRRRWAAPARADADVVARAGGAVLPRLAALLGLLHRGRPARLAAILGACALTVIAWRAFLVAQHGFTPRVHYGPDVRCDGLLIGAAVAAARSAGLLRPFRRWGWLALAAFAAATAVGPGPVAYALVLPAVAVVAVFLILWALDGSRLLAVAAARLGRLDQLRHLRLAGDRLPVRRPRAGPGGRRDRRRLGVDPLDRAPVQVTAEAGRTGRAGARRCGAGRARCST